VNKDEYKTESGKNSRPQREGGGRDGRPVAPLFSPLSRRLQYGEVKTIDETVELKQEAWSRDQYTIDRYATKSIQ